MLKMLKKALVVIITVCTFGIVTPPASLLNPTRTDKSKANVEQVPQVIVEEKKDDISAESFITYAVGEAERQTKEKFGSKISPVIGTKFDDTILPKVTDMITSFANQQSLQTFSNLAVSQYPKGGENEKILHIYDICTNEDLLRFHVRRDHPPKDGYYFDFHYHTAQDNFVAHHELGTIYWGKNQPPQWLS
ncbi:YpjP family protein [Ectobacillus polymachus]|uniref:YpjP family protein n=1 Tax=Ectobacillus polymachus TaxID=1508806 RepID=UPI003A880B2F